MQGLLRTMVWILVIFAAICGLLYLTVFDVWVVPADDPKMANSLTPNSAAGDVLLLFKHGDVSDGQLARCVDPQEPLRFVMARVEGMDGETLQIQDQRIVLDRKPVPMPRGCGGTSLIDPLTNQDVHFACSVEDSGGREHNVYVNMDDKAGQPAQAQVERGKVYLVSDNRYWHLDSRDYGTIPAANCQHIVFRLWGAKGWLDTSHRNTLLW